MDYGNREIVPDPALRKLAGSAYFRAREVSKSGRMGNLVCEFTENYTKLSSTIEGMSGFNQTYHTWASIDEGRHEIIDSHCDCPAYGRYGAICKHVIALILHYNEAAHTFDQIGTEPSDSQHTSRVLKAFMAQQESQSRQDVQSRQLELLKKVDNLADAGNGQTSRMIRGSVWLRLGIDCSTDSWALRLRIGVHNSSRADSHAAMQETSYAVKDVRAFILAVRSQQFVSYGKKLAFIHTLDAFDERSRALFAVLDRALQIRQTVGLAHGTYHQYPQGARSGQMVLSDDEISELLDLYVDTGATLDYSPPQRFFAATMPALVVGGDPDLGLEITSGADSRAGADAASGGPDAYRRSGLLIRRRLCVECFIHGYRSSFVVVRPVAGDALKGTDSPVIHRCSPGFLKQRRLVSALCADGDEDELYVQPEDITAFSRTVLPFLRAVQGPEATVGRADAGPDRAAAGEAGTDAQDGADGTGLIRARMSPEIYDLKQMPCVIETYLDRDGEGIVCRVEARYGAVRFDVFGSGVVGEESRASRHTTRDREAERLAVEAVLHYFPRPVHSRARIPESDDAAIYRLLTEGLPVLRDLGSVFCTQAFDGLTAITRPTISLGLSVKSDLVEISTIADEIDPDEVAEVLNSYRRNRRFHRLRNGTFVDVGAIRMDGIDEVAADLNLTRRDFEKGVVTVPGYAAYYLDNQIPDSGKDESFLAYMRALERTVDSSNAVPPSLSHVLRPYQTQGFHWLDKVCDRNFGGILADEMGLGKTVQLLALLLSRRDAARGVGPNLIVCPASLVYNWAAECRRFTPSLRVAVVAGSKASRRETLNEVRDHERAADPSQGGDGLPEGRGAGPIPDVLITSYDLLRRDIADYQDVTCYCMVLDEAQYIKNHATKSAKAVRSVQARHRFALTGTPIENRLSELWSIFDFLMPGILGSYRRFRDRFELPILSGDTGAEARLQGFVHPFILRRLKSDVLKDLPDKIENVIRVQLQGGQRKLYAALEQQLRASLNGDRRFEAATGRIQVLAQLTKLREACCDPRLLYSNADISAAAGGSSKLDAIEDLVSTCQDLGKKMLIFSQFTSFLDLIAQRLDAHDVAYDVITGATAKKQRVELVDRFNHDDTPVFLISLKAGNTGLNLTGASVVVHADPWWNAAAQEQATDRAHRIGQTRDVNVYQIVAQNTVEERILNLQRSKTDLASRFVGAASVSGSSISSLSTDDLLSLLG